LGLDPYPWARNVAESAATILGWIEEAIRLRTSGGAASEWSEGASRYKGESLSSLFAIRKELRAEVQQSGRRGGFRLYQDSGL